VIKNEPYRTNATRAASLNMAKVRFEPLSQDPATVCELGVPGGEGVSP
jgi:hypothetical protein